MGFEDLTSEPNRACEEPVEEEKLDLSPDQLDAIAGGVGGRESSLDTCPQGGSRNRP